MPSPVLPDLPWERRSWALLLGLAPLVPAPHPVEKRRILCHGSLKRPIDSFNPVCHRLPRLLLGFKLATEGTAPHSPALCP